MFLNHKWERDELKQQSGAEYFCSYNQQSHRKKYLKREAKIRQLSEKYTLNYQKETNQTKNWENLSNLSFLIFSAVGGGGFSFFLAYFKKKEGIIFVFL